MKKAVFFNETPDCCVIVVVYYRKNDMILPAKKRLLLIEDNKEAAAFMAESLKEAGYEVTHVRFHSQARALLASLPQKNAFFAILSDGATDNRETLGEQSDVVRFLKDGAQGDTPVFVITGSKATIAAVERFEGVRQSFYKESLGESGMGPVIDALKTIGAPSRTASAVRLH